jgi:peptidyl-prolyl cis-trans isomerase SurA
MRYLFGRTLPFTFSTGQTAVCVLALFTAACTTTKKSADQTSTFQPQEAVLFTVANDSVRADEFMYVYRKNQADSVSRMSEEAQAEAVRDYLKLYVNFKLKVKAAEAAQLDQKETFKQELAQYQQQLAKPYLVENRVTEQLIEEAYERSKQEVKASHILITVAEDAAPADTLQAFQKADSLRQLALNGASFAMLAEQYSDDPSAASNGGDLGYFTALQMVYPFENAAYRTEMGSISPPIRTRFGYHIIKVHDKRPSKGKVKVAHIMIREGENAQDSSAQQKAQQIYEQMQQGGNWNELAERFSDDVTTRSSGGELPFFGTGNMIESFEDAAFALKNPGDISPPVKTRFGWHVIKLIEQQGLEPLSELRPSLERRIDRSVRSEVMQSEMVDLLKQENGYQGNAELIQGVIDQTQSPEARDIPAEAVLFTMQDTTLTAGDFYAFLKGGSEEAAADSAAARQAYQDFEAQSILAYEERHLLDKYEDYRRILQEYRDGILLFDIMEKKVWSKAMDDSVGLRDYFAAHRDDYRWNERVRVTLVDAESERVLNQIKQNLQDKELPLSEKERTSLEKKHTKDSPLALQIRQETYERGQPRTAAEAVIDQVDWSPGAYTIENNGRFYYIRVQEVLPPQLKELDEIKGIVIADYQNYLDQQWVSALRQQYLVEINDDVLQKVTSALNNR